MPGQVLPMPDCQTLKSRATQLLIKYKSGALVTQCCLHVFESVNMHLKSRIDDIHTQREQQP